MENLIPKKPDGAENGAPADNSKIEKAKDSSVKSLAVFGMVCLLGLVSIGIIKIAPAVIRGIASAAVSLSSVFVPAGQSTQQFNVTSTEYTVASGEPFTVNWEQPSASQQGSFVLSYPCVSGLHFEAVNQSQSSAGASAQNGNTIIYCNTDFQFLNNNNSIELEGFLTAAGQPAQTTTSPSVQVPITIHFTPNGASKESAEANVTISVLSQTAQQAQTGSSQTSSQQTPATTAFTPGQETQSVYPVQIPNAVGYTPNTNADLAVTILATGIIDPTTNAFVPEDKVEPGQRAAIQFAIVNQGGRATGSWSFAAVLPTYPAYTFMSNAQPSLNPGDKIVYTIGFDQIALNPGNSGDTFIINADNTDSVTETNKANNIVSGVIYVDTTSSQTTTQ